MKYLIIIGDGMGDFPRDEFGGKTPLEQAKTPHMDRLAKEGELGRALTIPEGFSAGSDVANLCILGYDPSEFHTGRSPIEAASLGIKLAEGDVSYRCNLVVLDELGDDPVMADYCAEHIASEDGAQLIASLDEALGAKYGVKFHPGTSFRNILIWPGATPDTALPPAHDISDQRVGQYMGDQGTIGKLSAVVRDSWEVLKDHPVNQRLKAQGKSGANSVWLWGQGTQPALTPLQERFGLSGPVISAVDLVKGLGVLAGLDPVEVPGATAWLDTNYAGKVQAALDGLKEHNFAYLHVEAPDEAGHSGKLELKMEAIELFDQNVVGPVMEGLKELGPHRVMLLFDHYTPLATKGHDPSPVAYVIWDSEKAGPGGEAFNETAALKAMPEPVLGYKLIERLLKK